MHQGRHFDHSLARRRLESELKPSPATGTPDPTIPPDPHEWVSTPVGAALWISRPEYVQSAGAWDLGQIGLLRRGQSIVVRAAGASLRAKRKVRGGLLASAVPSLYRASAAVHHITRAYRWAETRNVAAPRLAGILVFPARTWMAHLAVFTEDVPSAVTLAERLRNGSIHPTDMESLGHAVSRLHHSGMLHGDLNASNIVMPTLDRSYVYLDLDDARFFPSEVGPRAAVWEVRRLGRSLFKTLHPEEPMASTLCEALMKGYFGEGLSREEQMKALVRTVRLHRILW